MSKNVSRRHFLHTAARVAAVPVAAATLGALPIRAARAAATQPLKKIRVMDVPKRWIGYELLFLADHQGYFAEQGLALELVSLPIDQYTVAIASGVTDFALSADYIYLDNVRAKGLVVKEVVNSAPFIDPAAAGDGLFVRADSPIRAPQDLRGKRIGMRSVTFSSAWFTLDYVGRAGLHQSDLQFLTIPDLQLEQVLQSGAVDAVFAYGPIDAQLREHRGYRQLFQLSDLSGRKIQRGGTMVREDFISQHPDIVRGYVAAIAKAADYANQHQQDVVDLGVRLGRVDPAVAPWMYTKDGKGDYSVLRWPTHGLIDPADVAFWLQVAERQDVVPKGQLKVADLYTNALNPYQTKT
ncbi:ABC transporter substrate-binding protein [Burkholderia sp. WAC0059]|uniref:ABC transporter substrate-binding protein n=1 Tax=Burkholderia sp. WAC0059 TaxID=2066022 RepID=UPI0015E05F1E|nr:ABC transporter substrate-binding protein [Burkholderia sp. WAC0059]